MSSDELIEPITPSHLCGRRIATLPDHPTEDEDGYVPGNENTGDNYQKNEAFESSHGGPSDMLEKGIFMRIKELTDPAGNLVTNNYK